MNYDYDFGIILVNSNNIIGDLVKLFINSPWNHICILFVGNYDEKKKVMEPTGNNLYVIESNWYLDFEGIKITKFNKFVENYNAREMRVRILKNENIENKKEKKEIFAKTLNEILEKDIGYEKNINEFQKAIKGNPLPREYDNFSGFICSEFVAYMFREIGMLPKSISATGYFPTHFDDDNELESIKKFKSKSKKLLKEKKERERFLKNKFCILNYPYTFRTVKIIKKLNQ